MELRGPAVGNSSGKKEGRGEMTKTPVRLQDLRRRIYVKAKAEPAWRFSDASAKADRLRLETVE